MAVFGNVARVFLCQVSPEGLDVTFTECLDVTYINDNV